MSKVRKRGDFLGRFPPYEIRKSGLKKFLKLAST